MSWSRLAAAAVGIASTIAACAKYGSEEEPTIVPIDAGNRGDATGGNDVLVPEDSGASADADAGPPTIDCLGVPRPAFFCDGFEGMSFDPAWTKIALPAGDPRPDLSLTTQKAIAGGARSAYLGFSTLPTNGVAMLRWSRGGAMGPGPLSLQWSVFWPKDGFDIGQTFPIAALRAADGRVATVSIRVTGVDAAGDLLLTIGSGEPINLGAITPNTWSCIELAHDGTDLTAYRGDTAQVKRPLATGIDSIELGYEWPYPENGGAGAGLYVDDVIVSPSRIGCIH